MRRSWPIAVLLAAVTVLAAAQNPDELAVKRYGLFVASNDGGGERQTLRWADEDVRTISRTMSDLGGIEPTAKTLLFDPSVEEIDATLADLQRTIRTGPDARRTEVMFYYSGHSDERGLLLGSERYLYGHLRDELGVLGADVIIAVLDSCASGAFTRDKGGTRKAPFLLDDSSRMEGHAFLTSSSADEASQESDVIGGSFFTHYLVSGLRGAADTTRDGRVTLNEIYQHTYAETLARTEQTLGGPQHPAYDIRLNGTGDLVLTDLTRPSATLLLDETLSGRVYVRDGEDRLVMELAKRPEESLTLALPAGAYALAVQQGDATLIGTVDLPRYRTVMVSHDDLDKARPEYTRSRGIDADRERYPIALGVVPGLSVPASSDAVVSTMIGLPIAASWAVEGFQGSLFMNITKSYVQGVQASAIGNIDGEYLQGAQLAGLFNVARGPTDGYQGSAIFNTAAGELRGAQTAGIFSLARGPVSGIQVSGIFNSSGGDTRGVQIAGITNISRGNLRGAQIAGIYNTAEEVRGVQIGLVNVSDRASGLLVGLVNYSRDMRAFPLGLINISQSGIRDLDFRWEQGNTKYLSFRSGNRYFYTRFIFGFQDWNFFANPQTIIVGFGTGFRASFRPFFLELDIDWKTAMADYAMYPTAEESFQNFMALPTVSLTLGLGRRWGIYGGVGFTFKTPWQNRHSVLLDGGTYWDLNADGSWGTTMKWYVGIFI